jgi:hypothetical protein
MRLVTYFLGVFIGAVCNAATPVDEIESLLHYIGTMESTSIVRNGDVHTPKEAEAHLRLKWTKQKAQIATAEDFIRLCGTKSSMSGKAYVIRFQDGHAEDSAAVLSKQLQVIRAASLPENNVAPNKAAQSTTPSVTPPAGQEARQP